MPTTFAHEWKTGAFTGKTDFNTGVYIDGEWRDGSGGGTIDVINPTNGKLITKVAEATQADVDLAVKAAQRALDTTWGLNASGAERAALLNKLGLLMERDQDVISALEALDNGKTFGWAKGTDVAFSIATVKYYAGWADKVTGQTLETDEKKLIYTRHEPIGVVGQIIPWPSNAQWHPSVTLTHLSPLTPPPYYPLPNSFLTHANVNPTPRELPLLMFAWKIGPALATGNAIVLKPSEFTPLTALYMTSLFAEAGFPKGSVNILVGYGHTVGQAISEHMDIQKVAFTGSTLVGRKIMAAAAASNLKNVTLELGGKSPNIVFDDADLEQAVGWSAHGIFWNHGQACCAGSRIYVQAEIYDKFLAALTERTKKIRLGDPFALDVDQGPQVSEAQFDDGNRQEFLRLAPPPSLPPSSPYTNANPSLFPQRIMSYIDSGKAEGATVHTGGERHGTEGYFIQPTIFTDCTSEMKIVREEIFGPVGVIIKFTDEADVIRQANDTVYGLACAVFSQNINRALETAHKLKAGTAWVNCANQLHANVPFGGFKQSGIGRELGEYALHNYTNVKAVHVNFSHKM
ncbi:aldehyde dehydrogenase [Mycena epipterygia]|nr:aldehyde dehydrogenase [Mycena epipterygia]